MAEGPGPATQRRSAGASWLAIGPEHNQDAPPKVELGRPSLPKSARTVRGSQYGNAKYNTGHF
jgi:hypothetical protein